MLVFFCPLVIQYHSGSVELTFQRKGGPNIIIVIIITIIIILLKGYG